MARSGTRGAWKLLALAGVLAGAVTGCKHCCRNSDAGCGQACTVPPCECESLPEATYPDGPLGTPVVEPAREPEKADPQVKRLPPDVLPPAPAPEVHAPADPVRVPSGAKRRSPDANPLPSLDAAARRQANPGQKITSFLKTSKSHRKPLAKPALKATRDAVPPVPPEWSDEGEQPVRLSAPTDIYGFSDAEVPDAAPRRLHSESADEGPEADPTAESTFLIDQASFCQEIRGYGDVTTLDTVQVSPGQPVLIYASLSGFTTRPEGAKRRTVTESSVEIYRQARLVTRQSLGEAVDLAQSPRSDYFLTHRFNVPAGLSDGDYVFRLVVRDVQGRQSAAFDLPVTITGGHILRDGTDGSEGFAALPSSTR